MPVLSRGLLQIYTGAGKGKTTAALGLTWRMLGRGGKVYFCQFLKPADLVTGEALLAESINPNLRFDRLQHKWNMAKALDDPRQVKVAKEEITKKLREIKQIITTELWDMVVLDEIIVCLDMKLTDFSTVLDIIKSRPPCCEIILTGRGASQQLIETADLVTAMESVKHPFNHDVPARKGIEY